MARTKAIWTGKIVPDSIRAEGRNYVSFNVIPDHEPDRVIRVTQTVREMEEVRREISRAIERAAARDVFKLGE